MKRQFFRLTLFFLISLSIPLTATAQIVDIPDPNLRAAIEYELGKTPGAAITVADMLTLTDLYAARDDISDLAGLEAAINLGELELRDNNISDISALAGLTQLYELDLADNNISDISALTGLTQLYELNLQNNSISDLSPLVANIGLGIDDWIDVRGNFLNATSINTHIPTLEGREVRVSFHDIVVRPEDITQTVDIPDPNLQANIAYARGKMPSDPITVADMVVLISIQAEDSNIRDLTGLEHAINLTTLWLDLNSISDISPLAGLTNLRRIDLRANDIFDLSPLVANTGLGSGDSLNVRDNPLNVPSIITHIPTLQSRGVSVEFANIVVRPEDIAKIVDIPDPNFRAVIENRLHKVSGDPITAGEMATLVYLYADTHYFSDLTGIEHATNLKVLNLQENSVSDISPLTGLTNLTELNLTNNRISDISPLARLNNLKELNLRDNRISDISPLAGLNNLKKLRLGVNSISDISPLAGLNNLTVLDLTSTSISDISPIAGLNNLITLYLGGNAISDISPLARLNNLTQLFIWENSISDISPLTNSTNLTRLEIGENAISDISPLAGLNNLIYLSLSENAISDISPLARLNNLTQLYLRDNRISDISPLAGLNNLIYLSLSENAISDISPLVANTRFGNGHDVNLRRNPLNFSSRNIHIPALQSRGVTVWFDDTVVAADVNGDGVVNILDLVLVGAQFGKQGQNLAEDVNGDGTVNILDLVWVAAIFGDAAAAPSAYSQAAEVLTPAAVRGWLTDAKALEINDPIIERGVIVLERLLASLAPTETQLLPNYPNPFNPETWIPYRLAKDAFVTLTIYDGAGHVVRTIDVGHQIAATYENRAEAIYWNGRNQIGEKVASGVYFYHLSAGDFSATRKMLILK